MNLIDFFVQDFSRFYPATILIFSLLTKDIYLFFVLLIGEQLNHVFKYNICKPIMGKKKYPILGTGTRPPGAVDCGLRRSGSEKKCPTKSYGMPSGHAQTALLFSTYYILNLLKNNNNSLVLYGLCVFFAGFIPWSRVYLKVHTTQQVIIGSIIGSGLGYFFFYLKPFVMNLIM
tara:strand:+ start:266 stop:787 length:522 start_codon:yes stop_codon:yes gene_type:complete